MITVYLIILVIVLLHSLLNKVTLYLIKNRFYRVFKVQKESLVMGISEEASKLVDGNLSELEVNGKKLNLGCKISILLPMRNEERNVVEVLTFLAEQDYKQYLVEVIILDDRSSDKTKDLINTFIEKFEKDKSFNFTGNLQFKLVEGSDLPTGWGGKNWASHQLSEVATGEYLIFFDADVRGESNSVYDAILLHQLSEANLTSIFPTQQCLTIGEKIFVPALFLNFYTFFPLYLNWSVIRLLYNLDTLLHSKSRKKSVVIKKILTFVNFLNKGLGLKKVTSTANGQCLIFTAEDYRAVGGHKAVKENSVEDIAFARLYSKSGLTVLAIPNFIGLRCRMYNSGSDALYGLSRSIGGIFGSFFYTIFFTVFHCFVYLGVILLILVSEKNLNSEVLFVLLLQLLISLLTLSYFFEKSNLESRILFILLIPVQYIGFYILTMFYLFYKIFNKKIQWRERVISIQ